MRQKVLSNADYRRTASRKRRRGFTFTEILFAVMILGIGFIMVAAMFPVAIRQTEETIEETTAAGAAREGASYMARIATNANFPVTSGRVVADGAWWPLIAGNLILPNDTRYAWIPFYSRGANATTGVPSPYAQITVIGVQVRNTSSFSNADIANEGIANLQGRLVLCTFHAGGGAADTVDIAADGPGSSTASGLTFTAPYAPANNVFAAGEGAYLIVADDSLTTVAKNNGQGVCDGYVYRLGNRSIYGLPSQPTFELAPGNDMKNARYQPTGGSVRCFLVGAGYANPGTADTSFSGPVMDVSAFSTFVKLQ